MRTLLLSLGLAGCAPGLERVELDVDGVKRSFYVHVPEALPADPPLMFVFHGGGGHGRNKGRGLARFTGMNEIADRDGFLVIYPNSRRGNWNDGRDMADDDDLGFFDAMLAWSVTEHGHDPHRVWSVGISNGGFLSERLACERSESLAGIASVVATRAEDLACAPARPVPHLWLPGTEDPLVPYEGGVVAGDRGRSLGVAALVDEWAALHGCDDPPTVRDWPDREDDGTTVHEEVRCGPEAELRLLEIRGGGHTWPGASQYLPKWIIGPVSDELDGSEEIAAWLLERPSAP